MTLGQLGDAAKTTVSALKDQPALLVVILLNVTILGLSGYILFDLLNDVGQRTQLLLDRCLPRQQQG